ncbi:ectonucleotide pyrophosphatase/phosphodiesterase [Carboxylicivirga taeanensis]|uniref:alkaline phosphatase family protein n=1 Tax=Carboxylicivirga taeanensis TaxID=1416875 RepID=UPI003F6E351C
MRFLNSVIALFIFKLCSPIVGYTQVVEASNNYLLVVSLDGFRWDYQDLYNIPILDSIEHVGVKASSLQPAFPSKTFPNHYTIATGLYPDSHGLVSNSFFCRQTNDYYSVSNRARVQDGEYYGGEPIWVSAEKQGLKSASYYWIGSEAKIKGKRPSIWKVYDSSVSYEARIDSVVNWFQLPYVERPRICMLYFDEPDKAGHRFGPVSDTTKNVIESLNGHLSILCARLSALPIKDSINVIILSDHGMGPIHSTRNIDLSEVIDTSDVEYMVGSNPFFLIEPKEERMSFLQEQLGKIEGLKVWSKQEIPSYLHYGTHENIANLVVVADSAWSITMGQPGAYFNGTHGYEPTNMNMHGIFYAFGPAFKKGYRKESFESIHIYELMCKLLNIEAARNDGDLNEIEDVLK